ncbi:PIN domain-containing protein [Devosia sp. A369]
MSFLLDTNVLSEVRRPQPDARVLAWLDQVDEDRTYLSAISIAEIRRGVGLLEEGRRKQALGEWLEGELLERFDGRILPIDTAAALVWGELMAGAKQQGMALAVMDGLIAACAVSRGLTLVTRNTKDFIGLPLPLQLLNP